MFIGIKVETHKTTSFWLLEAQNDVILEVSFKKKKKKIQAPQNDAVLGCSDLKKKKEPQNDVVLRCFDFFFFKIRPTKNDVVLG